MDAVLRLKGSGNLDYIQIIKKPGGSLKESYLEDGWVEVYYDCIVNHFFSWLCFRVSFDDRLMDGIEFSPDNPRMKYE